ncbi:MAG: DUF1854 domain-containing protein [Clostridia bacterium]|nr:DUF1854 domain-containing protein [Clostridia bacterium]
MQSIYINGDEARLTRTGLTELKLELFNGPTYEHVEALRLFPVSGTRQYISLVDSEGKEIAIIRNLDYLMPDSMKAVEESLGAYYIFPKIKRVLARKEKYGNITWTVETDRGIHSFDIRNTSTDIKVLYDGRVIIKDSNDNRYEIESYDNLDSNSIKIMKNDM